MSARPLLFLLAHAGGSAAMYQAAFKGLAGRFELAPLELPGHGRRFGEPLLNSVDMMAADLCGQAEGLLAGVSGYVVFGHSMGGLLAFLLAGELAARGLALPARLVISSARVPGCHAVDPALLTLSDAGLWRASAERFGTVNREALESEELMRLFAPILRADLGAVVAYRPGGLIGPLDVPLELALAEHDVVGARDMEEWQAFTRRPIRLARVAGSHFHPLANPAAMEELIAGREG